MSRLMNGQVLFALSLAALNTIYANQVLQMDFPFENGEPGPAFLPMILCVFVYVAVARIFLVEFGAISQLAQIEVMSEAIPNVHFLGPLIAIGLTTLFIIGFIYTGYLASSLVYTFLIALLFNFEKTGLLKRSVCYAAITSIGITLFGWLFFVKLFGLYLPIWEF